MFTLLTKLEQIQKILLPSVEGINNMVLIVFFFFDKVVWTAAAVYSKRCGTVLSCVLYYAAVNFHQTYLFSNKGHR